MSATSYVRIRNGSTGAIKTIITGGGKHGGDNGFLALMWRKKRNSVDYCEITLDYDHPDLALLSDKDQVEIVRADPDLETPIAEYVSFDGMYRDIGIGFDANTKLQTAIVYCYGTNHLLSWRDIDYPSEKANYTKFTTAKAETILKRLVDTNLGPNALTANGRYGTAVLSGFSIEADSLRGNTLSTAVSHTNLLDALMKIAPAAGGDFRVVRTGVTSFQFQWVVNTNRATGSNAIIFSLENHNMTNPKLLIRRSAERTVMIVGGGGEGDDRVVRTVLGPNYSATNHIEQFVDARNAGVDTTVLDGIGAIKAQEYKLRNVLTYDVIQTPATQVERDYFLSNIVKGVFAGYNINQYVDEIVFTYKDNSEDVQVGMQDV